VPHRARFLGLSLRNLGRRMAALQAGETVLVRFDVLLSMTGGEYTLSLAAADQAGHTDPNSGTILNRQEKLGPLRVRCDTALMPFYGIAGMPTSGEVTPIAPA
jgi:hypothetical protein